MATVTEPLLGAVSAPVRLPAPRRNSGLKCTINSLDSLSLSTAGLTLGSGELKQLPKSLLDRVYAGYSKALKGVAHQLPKNLTSVRFSVIDKQLVVKSGETSYEFPLVEDADLKQTLRDVVDKARIYLPASFSAARTLPTANSAVLTEPEKKTGFNWDVISEVNSVGRNVASAIPAIARGAAAVIGSSGILGGVMSVAIGKDLFKSGIKTYNEATACNDTEGRFDGLATAGIGASFAAVGTTMVAGFAPTVVPQLSATVLATPQVLNAFAFAGGAGIVLMAGFMLAKTGYAWIEHSKFRDGLTGILENKELSQEVKAQQGITFLAQQIYVTEGEMLELQEKYGANPTELKTQVENKAKAKWAKFVRHVGEECATKIAAQIDSVVLGLGANDFDALVKAIDLLQAVDKASYVERVKQVITLFLSFLYLAVGILSFLTPLSVAVPILFAAGAAIFILVDSEWMNDKVNKLVFALKSDPNNNWTKPLAGRAEPLFVSEFQIGHKWHASKLKTRLEEVLAKANEVSLKIVQKNNRERLIGKISDFNHLCKVLKLEDIKFDQEEVDYSELTLDQVRALRFMDLMQKGVLGTDHLVDEALIGYREALRTQGIEFGPEIDLAVDRTVLGNIDATFNEDPSQIVGEINAEQRKRVTVEVNDAAV